MLGRISMFVLIGVNFLSLWAGTGVANCWCMCATYCHNLHLRFAPLQGVTHKSLHNWHWRATLKDLRNSEKFLPTFIWFGFLLTQVVIAAIARDIAYILGFPHLSNCISGHCLNENSSVWRRKKAEGITLSSVCDSVESGDKHIVPGLQNKVICHNFYFSPICLILV